MARATEATIPSSQSLNGTLPSQGSQITTVAIQSVSGASRPRIRSLPLSFKRPDRSGVGVFVDPRIQNAFECITGDHQSIQEEVSMSSSSFMQGLLIAENAG